MSSGDPERACDEDRLAEYVDDTLFAGCMGTVTDHVARKAALGDERRYAIVYYVCVRGEVPCDELVSVIDTGECDLTRHVDVLVSAGLITRVGAGEHTADHDPVYRATHIARQEIESDVQNIRGTSPGEL